MMTTSHSEATGHAVTVPAELRALPRWVVWRREPDPKHPAKPHKVLYQARATQVKAKSTDPETWGLLRSRARTIWLKAEPREHWSRVVAQGDVRPMRDRPRAMNELRALLASRAPLYEMADVVVETSGRKPEVVVDTILRAT